MDIAETILRDHEEQRRLFAMLQQIDDSQTATLAAVWSRLRDFLLAHAEAEERHFYPCLLRRGDGAGDAPDVESETRDAIKDHNEIRDAARAVDAERVGEPGWRRAICATEKANSDHMAEEERQGLADFRQHADLALRHDLALAFVAFELEHLRGLASADRDPDAYVRKHAPDAAAGGSGSQAEARRALEHGSSGSTADLAVEGEPNLDDRFMDVAYARRAEPLDPGRAPDQLAGKVAAEAARREGHAAAHGGDSSAPRASPDRQSP